MMNRFDQTNDLLYLQGQAAGLTEGIEKGTEKGIEKGRRQQCELATSNMLQKGLNVFLIAELLEVAPEFVISVYEEMQSKERLFSTSTKNLNTDEEFPGVLEAEQLEADIVAQ